ncbi:hypothetical protein LXL04_023666 [Taraxacum kok-saghyz]
MATTIFNLPFYTYPSSLPHFGVNHSASTITGNHRHNNRTSIVVAAQISLMHHLDDPTISLPLHRHHHRITLTAPPSHRSGTPSQVCSSMAEHLPSIFGSEKDRVNCPFYFKIGAWIEAIYHLTSSLLIVAEDIESEALATLILNKLRAGIKVCAIKAPGFGEKRKSNLQDLATLTGGEVGPICPVITDELGMNLDKMAAEMLGTCKRVTISKDDTVILDGAGDKKGIEERCEQVFMFYS